MKRTSSNLVPFAVFAMGALVLFLSGCGRSDESSSAAVPAVSQPSQPLVDAKLKADLAALGKERRAALKARETVVAQMEAKVDAVKARLKTSDERLVREELEKDPEWKSLYERCADANTAYDERRKQAMELVRRKMKAAVPANTVSK